MLRYGGPRVLLSDNGSSDDGYKCYAAPHDGQLTATGIVVLAPRSGRPVGGGPVAGFVKLKFQGILVHPSLIGEVWQTQGESKFTPKCPCDGGPSRIKEDLVSGDLQAFPRAPAGRRSGGSFPGAGVARVGW